MGIFAHEQWLRDRAGVHAATVRRWRAARRVPPAVARLAELELEGRLELIHDAWRGWTIDPRRGELIAPGGLSFRPGELLALPVRYQQLAELTRRENAQRHRMRDRWRGLKLLVLKIARRVARGARRPARSPLERAY